MLPKVTQKREKTPEQALASLMRLCARAEKSESDARRLMYGWGIQPAAAQQVLDRLIRDRFIDDSRYAELFVREKMHLSSWGVYKIRATLQRKSIRKELIDAALAQIDPEQAGERLAEQLLRKTKTIKYKTGFELRTKLIRYGLSLGFEYEQVSEMVEMQTRSLIE